MNTTTNTTVNKNAMKKTAFLFLLLLEAYTGYAFEGNDDNVTRDYYVQIYQSQDYIPDFKKTFRAESDRLDYKKVREYLNHKEEILRVLRMAGDEHYYGMSFSKLYATDYIQSLEDDMKTRGPDDRILLRLNSVRPNFNYNGEYPASYIESEILPAVKKRYEETALRDSLNETAYKQIQKNIDALQQDISLAEQAIFTALSPEFRDQDFRKWISLTFSGLIAILLLSFFWIIYRRSDASLSRLMLGSSGLQFITVFILIIAIILFGILKVLGGSELAAILSGISGYILGKGGISGEGKTDSSESVSPAVLSAEESGRSGMQELSTETTDLSVIPAEEEESKFLPGENY